MTLKVFGLLFSLLHPQHRLELAIECFLQNTPETHIISQLEMVHKIKYILYHYTTQHSPHSKTEKTGLSFSTLKRPQML